VADGFGKLKKDVVDRGLCMGCGTCVGVCPEKVLEAAFVDGEPEPRLIGKCTRCGLCGEVCPGASIPLADMDQWLFGRRSSFNRDPLGIFRQCLRGHAVDPLLRSTSSSGGATSAILKYALDLGVIDAAVIVAADPRMPWRCAPTLATRSADVGRATRTSVEMVSVNAILRHAVVERGFKKLAVVGLPCHIHGLRKIQMANRPPEIAAAIKISLGLLCASTYYFEGIHHLLREFAGIENLEDVALLDYRGGQWPGSLTAATKDGKIHHVATKHDYTWHFLMPGSRRDRCQMCPDFSARVADISLGDIFQKVTPDPNINSILVRTEAGEEFVNGAVKAGYLAVENHPPEFIPKSGMGWEAKEHANFHRMKFRKRYGWPMPDFQYPVEMCPLPGKLSFP
jgi:coenzyme F420 hydrogenase subunit beta